MIQRRTAGYFEITFEPPDWENPAGGAMEIIRAKADIPNIIADKKTGWSYDMQTKIWRIPETPLNEELIAGYRQRFLPPDPNQTNLFDEKT
jgi:hypothetical protein